MRFHLLLPFTAALLLLLGSSCNAFKKASSRSSAPMAPAEYSTKSGAEIQVEYIQKYNRAAIMEMERGGVPASIILAQGLLESASGQSELARSANNHFGVKCSGGWKGQVYMKKDDDRDKDGNLIESCFRKYNDVAESYYDHGEFLRDPKKATRYGFLFNLDRTDYKSWARGLQSAGYATSADYADRLINLIERHQLYSYDTNKSSIEQPIRPTSPTPGGNQQPTPVTSTGTGPQLPPLQRIGRVNDVKVVLSKSGESLDEIAHLYRINVGKVVDYNERHYPPGFKLRENTRIYIQEKRSKWHGRAVEHFVQEGQTMFDISQQYGICLEKLLSRNHLRPNEEPAVSEKILLKGTRKKDDTVRLRDTSKDPKPDNPPTTDNRPTTPTPPGKMTTDNEELFEIEGNSAGQPNQPDTPGGNTGQPATSGGNGGNPVLPTETNTTPPTNPWKPTPPTTPTKVPDGYHLVVKGETLYAISRKYKIDVPKLKQINNLKNDNIQAGQMLRIR